MVKEGNKYKDNQPSKPSAVRLLVNIIGAIKSFFPFLLPATRFSLWLFVTLYAKSTYKMPRQHTSNPKIPKVSQAIGSPFY